MYRLEIEEIDLLYLYSWPAEIDEDSLEDEYGSGTAEDGERLTGQQAEESAGQSVTQEGLQHTLHPSSLVVEFKGTVSLDGFAFWWHVQYG